MSDEMKKELEEKAKNPDLDKVETKATKAEMILKFKCQVCGEIIEFPTHCEQQMEYLEEGHKLKCDVCNTEEDGPLHCDKNMIPFITKA